MGWFTWESTYVQFIVLKNGSIKEASIPNGFDPERDAEALRTILQLTTWKPGMHKGKAVNTWFVVPIKFKLAN